jgi:hypothetical protein
MELYSMPACALEVGLVVMKTLGGGSLLREKSTITIEDFQSGRTQFTGAPMHFKRPEIKITARTACLHPRPGGCLDDRAGLQDHGRAAQAQNFWTPLPKSANTRRFCRPSSNLQRRNACTATTATCPAHIDIGQTMSLFNRPAGSDWRASRGIRRLAVKGLRVHAHVTTARALPFGVEVRATWKKPRPCSECNYLTVAYFTHPRPAPRGRGVFLEVAIFCG